MSVGGAIEPTFCLLKVLFLQAVTQWLKYGLISFCGLINGRDKVHWYPGIKLKIDKKWTYYGTFFEYFRLFRHVDAQVQEKNESLIHLAHVYTSETHTHSHTTSSVGLRTIFDKSRERVGARPEPGRAEPSWARRGGAVVGGWWWGRGSRGAAGCLAPRRQRRARLAGRRLMPRQDSLPRWWSNNTDGSVSVPTSSPAPTPPPPLLPPPPLPAHLQTQTNPLLPLHHLDDTWRWRRQEQPP